MKVLVAIDSFKGSATSKELNEALIESITDSRVTEKISVPIADGGEGTVHALYDSLGGKFYIEEVPDLTGKMMKAEYLVTTIEGKETAFIESATVVGIDRIIPSEETIKTTSTFGLGVLIKKIIEKNINEIYVTLGGSGTSDGGLGLLAGLGAEIDYKIGQNPLLTTKKIQIDSVLELLKSINLIALADVDNPYIGEKGFSAVFGPQKGGTPELLLEMDQLAEIVGQELSKLSNFSINEYPGAGAAGGLGGAVLAIGGQIKPGFQTISQLIHLEELIKTVDLVVTGEGKLDSQTEFGKVPFGVASIAQSYKKPVFALCGKRSKDIGKMTDLLLGAYCIHLGPITLEEAMKKETTIRNLKITGSELIKLFLGMRSEND